MEFKSRTSSCFADLPNELILIIWSYLGNAEAINIFGPLNCQRYEHLLEQFCYDSIDLSKTSYLHFHVFCLNMFDKVRMNVRSLKLGHEYYYSQLHLLEKKFPGRYLI